MKLLFPDELFVVEHVQHERQVGNGNEAGWFVSCAVEVLVVGVEGYAEELPGCHSKVFFLDSSSQTDVAPRPLRT